MRTQSYQIANKTDSRKIAEFLSKDGSRESFLSRNGNCVWKSPV